MAWQQNVFRFICQAQTFLWVTSTIKIELQIFSNYFLSCLHAINIGDRNLKSSDLGFFILKCPRKEKEKYNYNPSANILNNRLVFFNWQKNSPNILSMVFVEVPHISLSWWIWNLLDVNMQACTHGVGLLPTESRSLRSFG